MSSPAEGNGFVDPWDDVVAVDRMKQLHGIESGLGDMSMTVRELAMRRRRSTGPTQRASQALTSESHKAGERLVQDARSIRGRKVPDRKFNLSVGELSPFLNGWCETALRRLVDNFAGFAPSCVERQCEDLQRLPVRHPICQIAGTNEHVGTPKLVNADGQEHLTLESKARAIDQSPLSPLSTAREPEAPMFDGVGRQSICQHVPALGVAPSSFATRVLPNLRNLGSTLA
jgi:hypothetical protein